MAAVSGETRSVEDLLIEQFRQMVCEMPLGKISVSALCARVGVSRKTFYAHFSDLESVLARILREDVTEPMSKVYPLMLSMGEEVSAPLLNELCYKGILAHKDFYQHIITRNEERIFVRALQQCLREAQDFANDAFGITSHDERYEFASRFLAAGQSAVIVNWIRTGMKVPTAELGAWFSAWSMPALYTMAGRDVEGM